MRCTCTTGACFQLGGHNYTIEVDGKRVLFEMNRFSGPAVLRADGHMRRSGQPGPKHPFWTAVTHWTQQGRQVGADGLCVWTAATESPQPDAGQSPAGNT